MTRNYTDAINTLHTATANLIGYMFPLKEPKTIIFEILLRVTDGFREALEHWIHSSVRFLNRKTQPVC